MGGEGYAPKDRERELGSARFSTQVWFEAKDARFEIPWRWSRMLSDVSQFLLLAGMDDSAQEDQPAGGSVCSQRRVDDSLCPDVGDNFQKPRKECSLLCPGCRSLHGRKKNRAKFSDSKSISRSIRRFVNALDRVVGKGERKKR